MTRSFRRQWAVSLGGLVIAAAQGTALATATLQDAERAESLMTRSIEDPIWQSGISSATTLDDFHRLMLAQMPVRQRVDKALGMVINRIAGASNYVIEHAHEWRGQFDYDDKLRVLLMPALQSPRLEVRMAAFEIYLASFFAFNQVVGCR